ncbi:hypothetical protein KR038_012115, partial [Drosophila bunnanda]
ENDAELLPTESNQSPPKPTQNIARQHQQINQHMVDSQISVSSGASTQTAFFQSLTNSPSHYFGGEHLQHTSDSITSNISLDIECATNAISLQGPMEKTSSLLEQMSVKITAAFSIADVADLLHSQHIIISGGRSPEGCPLITFPDNNNFHLLEEADYKKIIHYLTSVPSLQDADLGFQLIVDRRKDRWTSVKTVLQQISAYFPGILNAVYVLRPSGLFQKALSEVSSKFSKEDYKFRLVICSTLSDLHEIIDINQLTPDMGGGLIYSHHEWIQQRMSLEKFSSLTHKVSEELDSFLQAIHDLELPNSVESTRKLLDNQVIKYDLLKMEILAAAKHGETLLNNIKSTQELKEFSERTGNISAIERLLVQLEETERRFDDFWHAHWDSLEQCLHLRIFEQDFHKIQNIFAGHIKSIAEMTEIGESAERASELLETTNDLYKVFQNDTQRVNQALLLGQTLIKSQETYPWIIVQPKCDELNRVRELIELRLNKRLDTLAKNHELMERVESANQWCANGVELLASQNMEKSSASADLAELLDFIASASDFKLSSPSEFKQIFLESTTPETKALVSQVLQRIDDVSLMCDKRIASLKKLALKPPRPVQQVTPEPAVPLQPLGGAPHFMRLRPIKV